MSFSIHPSCKRGHEWTLEHAFLYWLTCINFSTRQFVSIYVNCSVCIKTSIDENSSAFDAYKAMEDRHKEYRRRNQIEISHEQNWKIRKVNKTWMLICYDIEVERQKNLYLNRLKSWLCRNFCAFIFWKWHIGNKRSRNVSNSKILDSYCFTKQPLFLFLERNPNSYNWLRIVEKS